MTPDEMEARRARALLEAALKLQDVEGRPLLRVISYSNVDDGGPAFPVQDDDKLRGTYGMSLRDYFAAHAVGAYCAHVGIGTSIQDVAKWAYQIADAMLEARR